MNEQEYKEKLEEIERNARIAKFDLDNKYAQSNNPHKIGDIITDQNGTIKIESIGQAFAFMSKLPESLYYGTCCTKKGVPLKRGGTNDIYQSNIIAIHHNS